MQDMLFYKSWPTKRINQISDSDKFFCFSLRPNSCVKRNGLYREKIKTQPHKKWKREEKNCCWRYIKSQFSNAGSCIIIAKAGDFSFLKMLAYFYNLLFMDALWYHFNMTTMDWCESGGWQGGESFIKISKRRDGPNSFFSLPSFFSPHFIFRNVDFVIISFEKWRSFFLFFTILHR